MVQDRPESHISSLVSQDEVGSHLQEARLYARGKDGEHVDTAVPSRFFRKVVRSFVHY